MTCLLKKILFSLIDLGSGAYHVKKGEGVFKGFHYELLENEGFTVPDLVPPFKVWVDISIQGDSQSKEVLASFVYDQADQVDHVTNEIQHYLFEIGGVDGSGDVYDSVQSQRHAFSFWEAVIQQTEVQFSHSEEQGAALHQISGNYVDFRLHNDEGSNQTSILLFQDSDGINIQDIDALTVSFDIENIDGLPTGQMSATLLDDNVDYDSGSLTFVGNRAYATISTTGSFDYNRRAGIIFNNVTDGSDFTYRIKNIQVTSDGSFNFDPKKNLLKNYSLKGGSETTFPEGWQVNYGTIMSAVGFGVNPEPTRYWGLSLENIIETNKECVLFKNHTYKKLQISYHNTTGFNDSAGFAFHPFNEPIPVKGLTEVIFSMFYKLLSGMPETGGNLFHIDIKERDALNNTLSTQFQTKFYHYGKEMYFPYTIQNADCEFLYIAFIYMAQPDGTQFSYEIGYPQLVEGLDHSFNPLNNLLPNPKFDGASVGQFPPELYWFDTDDVQSVDAVTEVVDESYKQVPVQVPKKEVLDAPTYPRMIYRNEYPEVLSDNYILDAYMVGTELRVSSGQYFFVQGR